MSVEAELRALRDQARVSAIHDCSLETKPSRNATKPCRSDHGTTESAGRVQPSFEIDWSLSVIRTGKEDYSFRRWNTSIYRAQLASNMSRPVTRRSSSSEPNPGAQTKVRKRPVHDDSEPPKRAKAVARTSATTGGVAEPSSKRLRSSSNGREPTKILHAGRAYKANTARETKKPLKSAKSPRKTASTAGRVKTARAVIKRAENGVSRGRTRVRSISNAIDRDAINCTSTVGTRVAAAR